MGFWTSREILSRVLVLGERDLRPILRGYVAYYNAGRRPSTAEVA
jgi:hypothetical protein